MTSTPNPELSQPLDLPADTSIPPPAHDVSAWLFEVLHSPSYVPPMLPHVAYQLLQLTHPSDVDGKRVAALIEQDKTLMAMTLRVANSTVHRVSPEIVTIDAALARVGVRRVAELFLEAAVNLRVFCAPGYEGMMDQLRQHSSATAHVARMLSKYTSLSSSQAFMCGLLHDAGLAAGFIAVSEHYGGHACPNPDIVWPAVLEHHEAANWLLQRRWGLPKEIGVVLSAHHFERGDQELHPLACQVALADALVTDMDVGMRNEVAPATLQLAQEALGLDDHTLARARMNAEVVLSELPR